MLLSLFSHTEEFNAEFLGDVRKSSNHVVGQEVWKRYLSEGIKVTPGFTMFLVSDLIEAEESRIVALNLTPVDEAAREMFGNLIEHLSPPITNTEESKDYNESH